MTYAAALAGALQDGLIVVGADGRLVEVNDRLREMVWRSPAELVGARPPLPFWAPEDRRRLMAASRPSKPGLAAG
jgi:two-component system, LuxR family, sensor histidine kinase DctS